MGGPGPGAVVAEFFLFIIGGHAPFCTHIDIGGIVLKVKNGLVVYGTVRTIGTVLGHGIRRPSAPLVGAPIVSALWSRSSLAPGKIVAVGVGRVSTDIAVSPQGSAGKTEVDGAIRDVNIVSQGSERLRRTIENGIRNLQIRTIVVLQAATQIRECGFPTAFVECAIFYTVILQSGFFVG